MTNLPYDREIGKLKSFSQNTRVSQKQYDSSVLCVLITLLLRRRNLVPPIILMCKNQMQVGSQIMVLVGISHRTMFGTLMVVPLEMIAVYVIGRLHILATTMVKLIVLSSGIGFGDLIWPPQQSNPST